MTVKDIARLSGAELNTVRSYVTRGYIVPEQAHGRGVAASFDPGAAGRAIAVLKLVQAGFRPDVASEMVYQ